ncbi:unnamed protein product, partial [Allacma fusca]
MTPRIIKSPRVKRESIDHASSPTVIDHSHSGFQSLGSQPVRYARRARSNPWNLASISLRLGPSADAPTDTDTCGIDGLRDLTDEQKSAVGTYIAMFKNEQYPKAQDFETLKAAFIPQTTSFRILGNTPATCRTNEAKRVCTARGGTLIIPESNTADCTPNEDGSDQCRTI